MGELLGGGGGGGEGGGGGGGGGGGQKVCWPHLSNYWGWACYPCSPLPPPFPTPMLFARTSLSQFIEVLRYLDFDTARFDNMF